MAAEDFRNTLPGATDNDKFHVLCSLPYKHQAVWYLNAFWSDGASDHAEVLWGFVEKCASIDKRKYDGNALDELEAHRFLEQADEAHTVLEMRSKLRQTGAIAPNERPKEVPITHYLLFKYDADWHKLVNASQGDNSEEVAEAQRKLNAVQAAYDEADSAASAAAAALKESNARAAEAKAREEDAREAEAPFKAACEELKAARDEVEKQEGEYNNKTEQLKKQSEEGGVVSRNRAKVQLDAHLAEDPLPLRKAKLTLEAAQKKADKARAPFQEKTAIAEAARKEADAALALSEAAKKRADEAVDACRVALEEAEAYLNEVKNKPGCAMGAMWWIDRQLTEKRKYMPTAKGGIRA